MIKCLTKIAEALQLIYTELHQITEAVYSLQLIAEDLNEIKTGGD